MRRHGYEIFRDAAVALLAVWVAFSLESRIAARQEQAEDRRVEQQEILENLRFVRDRAQDPASYKPFTNIDLVDANLSDLRLGCEASDLAECASFQDADLRGADLTSVDLRNADMFAADLTGVHMRFASAEGAWFGSANLTKADLSEVFMSGARFNSAILREARLREASLAGARFYLADLTQADFRGANLIGAVLSGANLTGADLRAADLSGVDLTPDVDRRTGQPVPPKFERICYDAATQWPEGFQPPPSECADSE